ncbi:hypothetical protein HED60_10955 [Planctomycetales bacterium ZRK34]|nr:hypothetical protein HED60_10955 [Planctomycetales bacterium ZRK34]
MKTARLVGHKPPKTPVQQAARVAWLAPLLAIFIMQFTRRLQEEYPGGVLIMGCIAIGMILMGFGCAVWASATGLRHGHKRLLIPAAIGLAINGLLIASTVQSFIYVRQLAQARVVDTGAWIPQGEGWYVDRENTFALRLHDRWKPQKIDDPQTVLIALAADSFNGSLIMRVINISPATTLDTLIAQQRQEADSEFYLDVVGGGKITVDGLPCRYIRIQRTDPQKVTTISDMYFVISAGRAYNLILTAPKDVCSHYKPIFTSIVESWRVLKAE